MKRLLAATTLIVALLASTALADGVGSVSNARLKYLNKVIEFESGSGDTKLELWFLHAEGDSVYYVGSIQGPEDRYGDYAYARVKGLRDRSIKVSFALTDYSDEQLIDVQFGRHVDDGSESKSVKTVNVDYRSYPMEDPDEYWPRYDVVEVVENSRFETLVVKGDMFTTNRAHRILEPVTFIGTMDFDGCDGCEHGDQLSISGKDYPYSEVHVQTVGIGGYHFEDCPGDLHEWIETMVELEVPFRFDGRVTAKTQDYWDPQDYWTAADGVVYLGKSRKLKLGRFLDSLPKRFSGRRSVSLDDLTADMTIRMVDDKTLGFSYKDKLLKVNLNSGRVRMR